MFVDDSSMLPLASFPADSDYWGKGRAFIDIIASAFERDVIRSATLLWGTVGAALPVEGTGKTLREPADASGTSPAREQFVSLQTSYAAQLAATIAKLEAIVLAPNVTLLDRSLILWISETGEASTRSGRDIPVVLVGDLGGYLRQGQYLHYANRTQGDLLLTLAGAVSAAPFGDPAIAVSPLQELLAPCSRGREVQNRTALREVGRDRDVIVYDQPGAVDAPEARCPPQPQIGDAAGGRRRGHVVEAVGEGQLAVHRDVQVAYLVADAARKRSERFLPGTTFTVDPDETQRRRDVE